MPSDRPNRKIADLLELAGDLLEQQDGDPFKVRAYHRAAQSLSELPDDVRTLAQTGGRQALEGLPWVGPGIAAAIEEIVATGRWPLLERLRAELPPEALLQTVPGIGPVLARKVVEHLRIWTIEELDLAAFSGRLLEVPGIGPRRAARVARALDALLREGRPLRAHPWLEEPTVAMLLDVDGEYRERAGAGALPRIATRTFNPEREAWLPILQTRRGRWRFTALFSYTARAHELERVGDWVIVQFRDRDRPAGQCTVVTETQGPLKGRRVVRGRELQCARHHLDGTSAVSQNAIAPLAEG